MHSHILYSSLFRRCFSNSDRSDISFHYLQHSFTSKPESRLLGLLLYYTLVPLIAVLLLMNMDWSHHRGIVILICGGGDFRRDAKDQLRLRALPTEMYSGSGGIPTRGYNNSGELVQNTGYSSDGTSCQYDYVQNT